MGRGHWTANEEHITKGDFFYNVLFAKPVEGAVLGGIGGSIGKYATSFFKPELASTVGGLATFATIGALAMPLAYLPQRLSHALYEQSEFFREHPDLKRTLKAVTDVLLMVASVAAAAAVVGSPISRYFGMHDNPNGSKAFAICIMRRTWEFLIVNK